MSDDESSMFRILVADFLILIEYTVCNSVSLILQPFLVLLLLWQSVYLTADSSTKLFILKDFDLS